MLAEKFSRPDYVFDYTLKSLQKFQLTQNTGITHYELIKRVLDDNSFERNPNDSPGTIYSALSVALFGTKKHDKFILKSCEQELINQLDKARVPLRLLIFKKNPNMVKEFWDRPFLEEFKNYVIDLASLAFKVKIVVFSVPPYQNTLNENIFCNNFDREIHILELIKGTYEAIFPKGFINNYNMVQSILVEEIDKFNYFLIKKDDGQIAMENKLEMEVLKRLQSITSTDEKIMNEESGNIDKKLGAEEFRQSKWNDIDLDSVDHPMNDKSYENTEKPPYKLKHKKS